MIEFLPFQTEHLRFLKPQREQVIDVDVLYRTGAAVAFEEGVALSAWANSRCVAAAGVIEVHPHRAVAWALLSKDVRPYMLGIARKVRRVVQTLPYRRIEFTVADDFDEGKRFARLLGAKCETPEPMRFFGADGRDEMMYAITKEASDVRD